MVLCRYLHLVVIEYVWICILEVLLLFSSLLPVKFSYPFSLFLYNFTGDQDNYGWKIISSDVFRFPPYKSLLCALLGEYVITTTGLLWWRTVPQHVANIWRIYVHCTCVPGMMLKTGLKFLKGSTLYCE